ncbi:lyase family protein [Lysinibacter cavernae]|uniref:3-carboxy-cis,cis-muconate cycloisomerase n=1 Tax=Lysinibacter cavernae TaxID=1640652 RepID=A0A7X5R084_9MICO|nr:lyase family protein [Lysinibacter cavernae]NIH53221.1 3-carboxy-cis,cis-muconate cycloisomerase [Lysinibacter cavernae]
MSTHTNYDQGLLSPLWVDSAAARLSSDRSIVQAMLTVESEWMGVLAANGLADPAFIAVVEEAANADLYDLDQIARDAQGGGNPLIPTLGQLRRRVAETSPAAAARIHAAATSQDIVDTALMLVCRDVLTALLDDSAVAAEALAAIAAQHSETIMVARTLGQHSLPTTFGLKAAQWLAGVTAARRALRAALAMLPLQWGGAAGTVAALTELAGDSAQLLTDELAAALGLASPIAPWQVSRSPIMTVAAALAEAVAAFGKIGNDVALMTRPELGELSEPLAEGRGVSSAMPQKQNPVLSVILRSAAIAAPGALGQVFSASSSFSDERPDGGWHAEWSPLRELLRFAGGAGSVTRELVSGLVVRPDRMLANLALSGPLVLSERIVAVLVPVLTAAGISGASAQVKTLISDSRAEGNLAELLRDAFPSEIVSAELLADLLDPANYLGQARELVARIVADSRTA